MFGDTFNNNDDNNNNNNKFTMEINFDFENVYILYTRYRVMILRYMSGERGQLFRHLENNIGNIILNEYCIPMRPILIPL